MKVLIKLIKPNKHRYNAYWELPDVIDLLRQSPRRRSIQRLSRSFVYSNVVEV